jgi:hypothetical protein
MQILESSDWGLRSARIKLTSLSITSDKTLFRLNRELIVFPIPTKASNWDSYI